MPTISNIPAIPFGQLASRIAGELNSGSLLRRIYATDASEYQELPAGVVFPRSTADLREIIRFARRNKLGLIPRAAGIRDRRGSTASHRASRAMGAAHVDIGEVDQPRFPRPPVRPNGSYRGLPQKANFSQPPVTSTAAHAHPGCRHPAPPVADRSVKDVV